jgi:hypothetical protein
MDVLKLEGKVIDYTVVIPPSHKRRVKDIVQIPQGYIMETYPNTEYSGKNNEAKDNQRCRRREKPSKARLSRFQRIPTIQYWLSTSHSAPVAIVANFVLQRIK